MRRRATILAFLCTILLGSRAAFAQDARRVSLAATLDTLFQFAPAFAVLGAQSRDADGASLRVSGAFDFVANGGLQAQRALWPAPTMALSNGAYRDAVAQAGASLRTRENVSVSVAGSVPFASSIDPKISPDQPQVTGTITIPLLKFGRSAGPAAEDKAAALHASGASEARQDSESDLTARVAEQYWQWVGSEEQLKLTRELEALAVGQLKDVDELVAQRARAQVDRLSFAAAASDASAVRVEAEQAAFEQSRLVWQLLGLPPPQEKVAPMDPLPSVPEEALDEAVVQQRAHRMAQERPLLRALDHEVQAARVRLSAAGIAERPDVNLSGQVTVARVGDEIVIGETHAGYDGFISLQFAFPVQNRAARGALEQAIAATDASLLAALQQRNTITNRVETLSHALGALTRSYQARKASAEQFKQEYEAVRLRFRLGSATATDVLVADEEYMRASLALVADQTSYATTLAALVHEAGALNASVHVRDPSDAASRLVSFRF